MSFARVVVTFDPPRAGVARQLVFPAFASQLRDYPAEIREEVAADLMREYGPGTLSGDCASGFTFRPDPVEVTK